MGWLPTIGHHAADAVRLAAEERDRAAFLVADHDVVDAGLAGQRLLDRLAVSRSPSRPGAR
jgi:hypothetical protein